jgi:hypothetical protein
VTDDNRPGDYLGSTADRLNQFRRSVANTACHINITAYLSQTQQQYQNSRAPVGILQTDPEASVS